MALQTLHPQRPRKPHSRPPQVHGPGRQCPTACACPRRPACPGRAARQAAVAAPAGAGVLLMGGVGVAYAVWFRGPQVRTDLVTYQVEYKDLQLKIVERGSLEAKEPPRRQVRGQDRQPRRPQDQVGRGQRHLRQEGRSARRYRRFLSPGTGAGARRSIATRPRPTRSPPSRPIPQKQIAIGLAEQTLEKWIKGDYPQQLHKAGKRRHPLQGDPSAAEGPHHLGGAHGQEGIHDRQPGRVRERTTCAATSSTLQNNRRDQKSPDRLHRPVNRKTQRKRHQAGQGR